MYFGKVGWVEIYSQQIFIYYACNLIFSVMNKIFDFYYREIYCRNKSCDHLVQTMQVNKIFYVGITDLGSVSKRYRLVILSHLDRCNPAEVDNI